MNDVHDDERENPPEGMVDELLEEGIIIKDHLGDDVKDKCGYCGQLFGPEDIVIEKEVHGRKWCFCSEECYRDFLDASNFKDDEFEKEKQGDADPYLEDDEQDGEKEEEF